jgi:chemotaxis protein CheC
MPRELVVLHELANIGAGHAATALSQLFSSRVDMTPPVVKELTLPEAVEFLHPSEEEVSAALLHLEGDLAGLVVLLTRDTRAMLDALGMEPGIEVDVISECGNIVASKLACAIGSMTSIQGQPTPPAAGVTTHQGVVEIILALTAQAEPFVVAFSELSVGGAVLADLMFFPASESLDRIEALA